MSSLMVTVSGRLAEPRYGQTQSGSSYLSLSIGVDVSTGKDADGKYQSETYWYKATFWGAKADEYYERQMFVKGQYVTISGPIRITTYQANDGSTVPVPEFTYGFNWDAGVRPPDAPPIGQRGNRNSDDYQSDDGGDDGYEESPQQPRQRPNNRGGGNRGGNRGGNSGGGRGRVPSGYRRNRDG